MKYLIVNGDDFGASRGVTRGILEAHTRGILTSTSLMVGMPFSKDAAREARQLPHLSVGLHVDLTQVKGHALTSRLNVAGCRAELLRQWKRFQELMGSTPTHLDSHRDSHRNPRLLPAFLEVAEQFQVPLRGYSPVRYIPKFYGQWEGVTHLEQVSVTSLVQILETEIRDGCSELSCHPGYIDPGFSSSYLQEREGELATLCDRRLRTALEVGHIQLTSFRDYRLFA